MKKQVVLFLLALLPMMAGGKIIDGVGINGLYYNVDTETKEALVTFSWGAQYTGRITIPDKFTYEGIEYTVTAIGKIAFNTCTGLIAVTIPNTVTSIGDGAFGGCSSLSSIVIPNGVTKIGHDAFIDCTSLTTITLSNNLEDIDNELFCFCESLRSIVIPNSVKRILDFSFAYCNRLSKVVIGSSVKELSHSVFFQCSNLSKVSCYAENPPEVLNDAFEGVPLNEATLYVPAGSLEKYKKKDLWSEFKKILPLDNTDEIQSIDKEVPLSSDGFSIDGKRQNTSSQGITIIRMTDGTTKKVILK
jgi:hypothetical protein